MDTNSTLQKEITTLKKVIDQRKNILKFQNDTTSIFTKKTSDHRTPIKEQA